MLLEFSPWTSEADLTWKDRRVSGWVEPFCKGAPRGSGLDRPIALAAPGGPPEPEASI
jgi:hypothetical protein